MLPFDVGLKVIRPESHCRLIRIGPGGAAVSENDPADLRCDVAVIWGDLESALAEHTGRYTFEALLRASKCSVDDRSPDGQSAARSLLLRLRGVDGTPTVMGMVSRVHGLPDHAAIDVIRHEIGVEQLLSAVARSEGQAYSLRGIGELWPTGTFIWEVEEPEASRATYSVRDQVVVASRNGQGTEVIKFRFRRLTHLVRLLTQEHRPDEAIRRGNLVIDGTRDGLRALQKIGV
jgi:hypothetical protein